MFKKLLFVSAVSIVLSGCGSVTSNVISDRTLQESSSFTLDTSPNNIVVSNRMGDQLGSTIYFDATTGGKTYLCSMTSSFGFINSKAICNGVNGGIVKDPCNDVMLMSSERCAKEIAKKEEIRAKTETPEEIAAEKARLERLKRARSHIY